MIKLLGMVRSRGWKISFFLHPQVHLLIQQECIMCPHILCVYYSLVIWPVSQLYLAHDRNCLPMVENTYSSICLHFVCPSTVWLSSYFSAYSLSPLFILILCPKLFGIPFLFGLRAPRNSLLSQYVNYPMELKRNVCPTFSVFAISSVTVAYVAVMEAVTFPVFACIHNHIVSM